MKTTVALPFGENFESQIFLLLVGLMSHRRKRKSKLDAILSRIPNGVLESVDAELALEAELKEYGRHLVGLTALRQPLNQAGQAIRLAESLFASAFVLSYDRAWWLVTAGHILRAIDENIRQGIERISDFRLADHYGTGPNKNFIPFDYENAQRIYEHDEQSGVDYGFVKLRPYYVKLLKANNVVAIPANVAVEKPPECDIYFMMGFPKDSYNLIRKATSVGYLVSIMPEPSVYVVDKIDNPRKEWLKVKHPRFIGNVASMESIMGMSGGPIFGIELEPYKLHVVAIQSAWLPKPRVAFGFRLCTAVNLLRQKRKRKRS